MTQCRWEFEGEMQVDKKKALWFSTVTLKSIHLLKFENLW